VLIHLNHDIQIVVLFMLMEALLAVWCRPDWKSAEEGNEIYFAKLYKWVQTKTYLTQAPSFNVCLWPGWYYVFIKSLKFPNPKFNILDYVQFTSGSTRSAGHKLKHLQGPTNCVMNSYFFIYLNSGAVYQLLIHISESTAVINLKLKNHFWQYFINNFDTNNFIFFVHVLDVLKYQLLQVTLFFNLYPFAPSYFI